MFVAPVLQCYGVEILQGLHEVALQVTNVIMRCGLGDISIFDFNFINLLTGCLLCNENNQVLDEWNSDIKADLPEEKQVRRGTWRHQYSPPLYHSIRHS